MILIISPPATANLPEDKVLRRWLSGAAGKVGYGGRWHVGTGGRCPRFGAYEKRLSSAREAVDHAHATECWAQSIVLEREGPRVTLRFPPPTRRPGRLATTRRPFWRINDSLRGSCFTPSELIAAKRCSGVGLSSRKLGIVVATGPIAVHERGLGPFRVELRIGAELRSDGVLVTDLSRGPMNERGYRERVDSGGRPSVNIFYRQIPSMRRLDAEVGRLERFVASLAPANKRT